MGLKSLADLDVKGVEQLQVRDVIELFFAEGRQSALDASNIPSMAQLKNMISYDYPVAMLDNGNFATVTGKTKVISHNGTQLKTGINHPVMQFPNGKAFVDNLLTLLKAKSLAELADKLDVDEKILSFMSLMETINTRFLIYVHLQTNIPVAQLMKPES